MRFTLLLASSALAAGLALSACSGGSQAVPTGGQSVGVPMGHHVAHLVSVGKRDASCGTAFFACVTLTPPSSSIEICISTSGNCTSGLVGSWNFSGSVVTYPKGKKYKKIKVSFSPNPGNPTTNTFSAKKIKNTHGKAKWAELLNACEVTNPSSCLSGEIGIIGS